MNRDAIIIRAVTDVMKDRLESQNMRVNAAMLVPEFTKAIERFASREIPSPQVSIDAPDFGPLTEAVERFASREMPKMDAPVVNVKIDMTPIAKAITEAFEKQTEAMQKHSDCMEKMFDKLEKMVSKCMDKGKEIEIIKDSSGKITGARRK